MATGVTTAAPSAPTSATIGSGEGEGSLLLCSIHLGAQERAARLRGLAWSSNGDRLAVDGIIAINPDDGTPQLTGHAALSVVLDSNRVDFTVTSSGGAVWRGWLEAELVYDYAA